MDCIIPHGPSDSKSRFHPFVIQGIRCTKMSTSRLQSFNPQVHQNQILLSRTFNTLVIMTLIFIPTAAVVEQLCSVKLLTLLWFATISESLLWSPTTKPLSNGLTSHGLKGGATPKCEKLDGCPPWILHTEKNFMATTFECTTHEFPKNLIWKFLVTGGSETDSGSRWNRKRK